jgi:release factor glutamine methyltransferase
LADPAVCMPAPATAQSLLRDCPLPAKEARALLAHALDISRERLIAHPETKIDEGTRARFASRVSERRQGTPMAYLLGVQEFYGHCMRVTPEVLIPRADTELLVDTALHLLRGRPGARVLELGTGSGCIAIALALARRDLLIVASDRSPAALQVARDNCCRLGISLHLLAGDWYAPVRGLFDLIISNPPYIAAGDRHLAQLTFEPRAALTDGDDGLSALRTIVAGAGERLAPGGRLLVEHGYDQGAAVRRLMREHGFSWARTLRDLAGRERACLGASDLGAASTG